MPMEQDKEYPWRENYIRRNGNDGFAPYSNEGTEFILEKRRGSKGLFNG